VVHVALYHTYMISNIALNPHGTGCGETRRAAQWNSVLLSVPIHGVQIILRVNFQLFIGVRADPMGMVFETRAALQPNKHFYAPCVDPGLF
jgi:hypothetical protein